MGWRRKRSKWIPGQARNDGVRREKNGFRIKPGMTESVTPGLTRGPFTTQLNDVLTTDLIDAGTAQ
jgi:hypothetical protein